MTYSLVHFIQLSEASVVVEVGSTVVVATALQAIPKSKIQMAYKMADII